MPWPRVAPGGKGKGGKGKGGKGKGGKGKGKGGAQVPKNYQQGCWHCGGASHRRFECPKFTAELEKQRAGNTRAGSKGKGRGRRWRRP